ncbi:MAG: transcriptional repressor [Verrucomicrobiaceae bacterium]|nr:transcriptional repressor [Verrucomicrobiaceae bacterium]
MAHLHPHPHSRERDPECLHCQALDRAREAGLRRTRALEEVLRLLISASQPLTLANITEAQVLADKADRATIYRLLTKLERLGIIRRLGLHDRSAYYVYHVPGEHNDYLICTQCGQIRRLDLDCPAEELEKQISKDNGYSCLYHELSFYGVCPVCAAA